MRPDLCDRVGIEHAVLQAGLGGGVSGSPLAAAVSRAGGLGTVSTVSDPASYRAEIRRTRELVQGRPFAANLLFPASSRAHVQACVQERVPVVSLFFGFDRRVVTALHDAGCFVLHQVGTLAQAQRALRDGADGLIAQGEGAGGHVLATQPLSQFVPDVVALAGERPVLAAGGIHDRATAQAALSLGASGVAVGTRFVLTHESQAHAAYKQRLLAARSTLVTLLFGLGWPALHRVVPNGATERWCTKNTLGPLWVRAGNRLIAPLTRLLPTAYASKSAPRPRLDRPFYTPMTFVEGMDDALVDVMPLYAGSCVSAIDRLQSAAEVVAEIAGTSDRPTAE